MNTDIIPPLLLNLSESHEKDSRASGPGLSIAESFIPIDTADTTSTIDNNDIDAFPGTPESTGNLFRPSGFLTYQSHYTPSNAAASSLDSASSENPYFSTMNPLDPLANFSINLNNIPNSNPNLLSYHNRTTSLPKTLSLQNTPYSLSNFDCPDGTPASSTFNRLSMSSINDELIETFANQFTSLSVDESSNLNTRRNTLFSNNSVKSTSTSISVPPLNSAKSMATIPNSTITQKAINLYELHPSDLINLSKDQNGCRLLQKKIEDDLQFHNFLFDSLLTCYTQLMVDPFGNYLIQKMVTFSSNDQISTILLEISSTFFDIAVNLHGTRALQKLIGYLRTDHHKQLLSLIFMNESNMIVRLIHDLNGNHVIQKIILQFNTEDLNFLIDLILINLLSISTHKHGCCVLQKLLNKCNYEQIAKINNKILNHSIFLMNDQFGNYLIQFIVNMNIEEFNYNLLLIITENFVVLSCGKFSSNVVEKVVKLRRFNNVIIKMLTADINNVLLLIDDKFGNYVIQTILEIADWPEKTLLASLIRPFLPTIKYSNYGKRIHAKVFQILGKSEHRSQSSHKFQHQSQIKSYQINEELLPGINFRS